MPKIGEVQKNSPRLDKILKIEQTELTDDQLLPSASCQRDKPEECCTLDLKVQKIQTCFVKPFAAAIKTDRDRLSTGSLKSCKNGFRKYCPISFDQS